MKKKSIASVIIVAALISPSYAYAEETVEDPIVLEPIPEVVEDPREYPNVDALPLPSEELVSENPWVSSSTDPEPDNEDIIPASQDEPETWAVVDDNGNTLNVIVCDIDYCGSGWIPTEYDGFTPVEWARVVLQSQRDPVTGQNNGGHWGQYNFPTDTWTQEVEGGGTYIMPVEYGGDPVCILNCPVPENEEIISDPVINSNEENSSLSVEAPPDDNETTVETNVRSFSVPSVITKTTFSFSKKFAKRKNIKKGKLWVIVSKDGEKKVWKVRAAKKGKTKIVLPIKYFAWKIDVNYILKNEKKVSNSISIN